MSVVPSRVVITGIGMITGLGTDRESTWNALLAGQGAVRRLESEDLWNRMGLEPTGEPSAAFLGAPVDLAKASPGGDFEEPNIGLAVLAAQEAAKDAGLTPDDGIPNRRGCVIGTSKGGMTSITKLIAAQPSHPSDLWPQFWPNTPASIVAHRFGIHGPVLCPVAACATGLMSLWRAAELIQHDQCDVVFAGSTDASLHPAVLGAFSRMGVLARKDADPSASCRPFDRHRSGFVVGEGAAVMILESAVHAEKRGATIYAEWLAGGGISDSSGITQLDTTGDGLAWLMGEVLRRSCVSPEDIDYINLHGTGTRDNDRTETRAIRSAFPSAADGISCSSVKGALGHLLGAAGSVETACTLLALRDGVVPPTRNLTHPDPDCDLDYTPGQCQTRSLTHALKMSLGFGGHQVAAVFRKADKPGRSNHGDTKDTEKN